MSDPNEAEWRVPGMWKGRDSHWAQAAVHADRSVVYHTVPWAPQMEHHQLTSAVYRQLYGRLLAIRGECRDRGVSMAEFRWFVVLKTMAGLLPYESAALMVALGMLED